MAIRNESNHLSESEIEECAPSKASERQAEFAEAAEMRERGTLTPESAKAGVTSHLPPDETAFMYRSENSDK